jgi:hypothetical protein
MRHALRALECEDAALDELLRAEVRASMTGKRPSVPAEDVLRTAKGFACFTHRALPDDALKVTARRTEKEDRLVAS